MRCVAAECLVVLSGIFFGLCLRLLHYPHYPSSPMATDRLGIHLLDVPSEVSGICSGQPQLRARAICTTRDVSSASKPVYIRANPPSDHPTHLQNVQREVITSRFNFNGRRRSGSPHGKTFLDQASKRLAIKSIFSRFFSAHPQSEAGYDEIFQFQTSSTPLPNERWHLDEQHIPETLYQALDVVPEGSMDESNNWMLSDAWTHPQGSQQADEYQPNRPFDIRLAPEIWDMILECLQYDSTTLMKCVGVCRSWALSCREYIPEEGIVLKSQRDVFLTAREESCPCIIFH